MIYLIKLNIILALLCLLFQAIMHRDTFFGVRRAMLWGIYLTALVLPLCDVQLWMQGRDLTSHLASDYATYFLPTMEITAMRVASMGYTPSEPGCGSWFVGMLAVWALIYLVPVVWMTAKLLWQIAYIVYLRLRCPSAPILPNASPSSASDRTALHRPTSYYNYPRPCSPFSFGPWIFIYTDDMDEPTLRDVLIHEQAHVSGRHTLDIIASQLFCILFWWNPATWIMRREVRLNLEFIADKAVCDNTAESEKAYQYRLLGFATHTNVATISNNFNVLPLKRRIVMMNLRRTRRTGMVKYILFVPVAAALLLLSNLDALARKIDDKVTRPASIIIRQDTPTNAQPDKQPLIVVNGKVYEGDMKDISPDNIDHIEVLKDKAATNLWGERGANGVIMITTKDKADARERAADSKSSKLILSVLGEPAQPDKEPLVVVNGNVYEGDMKDLDPDNIDHIDVLKDKAATDLWGTRGANGVIMVTTKDKTDDGTPLYDTVDKKPQYPGGDEDLYRALMSLIRYPAAAQEWNVQARVIVTFIVEPDGTVSNIKATKAVHPETGIEMCEIVKVNKVNDQAPEEVKEAELTRRQAEGLKAIKAEAERVVSLLPERWQPGEKDGKPVRVRFNLPISFRLR